MPVALHIVEYYVAAFQTVFGIGARIVVARSLEQSHKYRRLCGGELVGRGIEVSFCRSLDAVCVRTEIHRICIHSENFVFVVENFKFHCKHPLLAFSLSGFADREYIRADPWNTGCAHTEHVLDQLLRNG